MKSFNLFKAANTFIVSHPLFVVYQASIMSLGAFASHIMQFRFSTCYQENIWAQMFHEKFNIFTHSPVSIYCAIVLMLLVPMLTLVSSFYIQAALRYHNAKLRVAVGEVVRALTRDPWVALYYSISVIVMVLSPFTREILMIYPNFFIALMAVTIIVALAFLLMSIMLSYLPQLLYDGYSSFGSILTASWNYLKKSIWMILEFMLTWIFLCIPVIVLAYILAGITGTAPLVMPVIFSLCGVYAKLINLIAFNMIYNQIRIQK